MCTEVILALNLICSECYMMVQCNITQKLIVTAGLSQRYYVYIYAVIVTAVWGSSSLADQVLNEQPTML